MAFDVVLMKKNAPVAPAQISLHSKSEACFWSMIHLSHIRVMMKARHQRNVKTAGTLHCNSLGVQKIMLLMMVMILSVIEYSLAKAIPVQYVYENPIEVLNTLNILPLWKTLMLQVFASNKNILHR